MKSILLIGLTLLLSACFHAEYDEAAAKRIRQDYQAKLDALPIGATHEQVQQWQKSHGLNLSGGERGYGSMNLPNSHFPVKKKFLSANVCNGFFLTMRIDMNEKGQVAKKELGLLGRCL
ncbi:hypothetical protein ACKLNO_05195 [Neisseriaceae bacterium B1]